jgi:hypothetical protein
MKKTADDIKKQFQSTLAGEAMMSMMAAQLLARLPPKAQRIAVGILGLLSTQTARDVLEGAFGGVEGALVVQFGPTVGMAFTKVPAEVAAVRAIVESAKKDESSDHEPDTDLEDA